MSRWLNAASTLEYNPDSFARIRTKITTTVKAEKRIFSKADQTEMAALVEIAALHFIVCIKG